MVRAKDLARVYFAGAFGLVVSGCFLYTAITSKRLAHQGNSVLEMNKNFHKEFNETGNLAHVKELPYEFRERMDKAKGN